MTFMHSEKILAIQMTSEIRKIKLDDVCAYKCVLQTSVNRYDPRHNVDAHCSENL